VDVLLVYTFRLDELHS